MVNQRVENNLQNQMNTSKDLVQPELAQEELLHQEPANSSSLVQEEVPAESSQPAAEASSLLDTAPAITSSDIVAKTHEIWEISEALDKLRQQQSTLTHYIRQLKFIRRQVSFKFSKFLCLPNCVSEHPFISRISSRMSWLCH